MLDDKKILIRARKVVVSNWFNVQQVRVRVTRSVINIHGHIQRLMGTDNEREGDESSLRRLDADLRAIPSCRGVLYELDNWVYEMSGAWRRLRSKKAEPTRPPPPPSDPDADAHEIPPE